MARESGTGDGKVRSGLSRDKRRLAMGFLLMALIRRTAARRAEGASVGALAHGLYSPP